MKQTYFTICILLLANMLPAQSSIPTIPGWKMQERNGRFNFTPAAVGANSFSYEVMPLKKSNGDTGNSWFREIANSDAQQTGYIIPANDNASVNVQKDFYNYT